MNKLLLIPYLLALATPSFVTGSAVTGNTTVYNGNVTLFAQCLILMGLANDTAIYRSANRDFLLVIDYSLYNMTDLDRRITRCFASVSGALDFEQVSTNLLRAGDDYYCNVEELALGAVDITWVRYQAVKESPPDLPLPSDIVKRGKYGAWYAVQASMGTGCGNDEYYMTYADTCFDGYHNRYESMLFTNPESTRLLTVNNWPHHGCPIYDYAVLRMAPHGNFGCRNRRTYS